MNRFEDYIEENFNKEKIKERLAAGEDAATIVIEKYSIIKDATVDGIKIFSNFYKSDYCAFCIQHTDCDEYLLCRDCDLYNKTGIKCSGTNDSIWGTVINSIDKDYHLNKITDFIDLINTLRKPEVFKIGKITVTLTPAEGINNVMMRIDGMKSVLDIIGSINAEYGKGTYASYLNAFNQIYISIDGDYITNTDDNNLRLIGCTQSFDGCIHLDRPMSHKTAMEIIKWIKICSDRLHELNEPKKEEEVEIVKFDPVIVTITNVLQKNGEKRKKVNVEGLTKDSDCLLEFLKGFPTYRLWNTENEIDVFEDTISPHYSVYYGEDSLYTYTEDHINEFVRILKLAVQRERELKEENAKLKEEWDGKVEVIKI